MSKAHTRMLEQEGFKRHPLLQTSSPLDQPRTYIKIGTMNGGTSNGRAGEPQEQASALFLQVYSAFAMLCRQRPRPVTQTERIANEESRRPFSYRFAGSVGHLQ